ncbi:MAG: hypothetical protein II670_04810 [Alphaproteobacteria bacterium]|nr:hypothetical protein [Alphaproteobacteria bacterium]
MTKKYWADWQKRSCDTTQIMRYFGGHGKGMAWSVPILDLLNGDIILSLSFHGDAVDIVVERPRMDNEYRMHFDNERITLHRCDVKRVYFRRNQCEDGSKANHMQ